MENALYGLLHGVFLFLEYAQELQSRLTQIKVFQLTQAILSVNTLIGKEHWWLIFLA
jgi:hypothetical protein